MNSNFILHERAKKYEWSGECFLSIKSFYHGKANYLIKEREYQVDHNNFLILNDCTHYHLTINTTQKTESFCVFFDTEFVSKFLSELHNSEEESLDLKHKSCSGINFFERNYHQTGEISNLLKKGRLKSDSGMLGLEKDEFYHQLLAAMIRRNSSTQSHTNQLKLEKKSTREEIYRRIFYVKDYIDCNYKEDLRLKELAAIGFLSENHLLRNFSQLLGCTPFQYISIKRIRNAKQQLLTTNKRVKEIAFDVGYTSSTNFSTYFKTLVGCTPSTIRKSDI